MKTRTNLILCALAVLGLVAVQPARAATVYWDLNGVTAGAGGSAPAGTWDGANTYWNSVAAGTGATAAWLAGDTAVFAAGSDATGTYTVTVSGTRDIGGLTFEEGTATLSVGTLGTLRLVSNAEMNVAAGTATVSTPITKDASNRDLYKTGAGLLTLTGSSTSIGGDVRVNGGSLTISGGGKLYDGAGSIGFAAADSGAVTVTGAGSEWNSSTTLRVGESGSNNSLTISNGAQVSSNRAETGAGMTNFSIGLNSGSNNNSVLVTGTGSTLDIGGNGYLEVGRQGTGNTLNIENGATASSYLFWMSGGLGNPAGASNSTVTVTGSGSTWTNKGNGDIADRGTGSSLNVLNSGTVNMGVGYALPVYFAYYGGADNNSILVDGTGSVWNTGALNDPAHPSSGNYNTITVSNGGKWNCTGTILLTGTGNAVNLDSGGELNITTLNLSTASSRLNFDGGRLIAQSTGTLLAGTGQINLAGPAYISTDYERTIANVIYGDGSLTKEGIDTLTLTGANTYTGDTTVSAGTLEVTTAFFDDASTVYISSGATLDLNHALTDTIQYLYLGGAMQPKGVYDASTPSAVGYLSGTGRMDVTMPEPATMALLGLGLAGMAAGRWRRGNR